MVRKAPPRPEARNLLGRGDFTALEQELEDLQRGYEGGKTNEYFVLFAFADFAAPDLQPMIERWATEHPHAWSALAARGMLRWAAANRARGTKAISETPQAQLDQMRTNLELAAGDFHAVLTERPGFLPAYSGLIGAARMLGDQAAGHAAIVAALRRDPNTYWVRTDYMNALEPRWGGSWEAMEAFAREAQAHAAVNPELIRLLGYAAADRAWDRVLAKDWRSAAELYTDALRFSRDTDWLKTRSQLYERLGQYHEELADLNEVLHYTPDWPGILVARARCLDHLGQGDASLRDYARAVELDPNTLWITREYVRALGAAGRARDEVPVYEHFLATNPDDVETLEDLGILYQYTLHQPVRARDLLSHAVEVAPERISAWRKYADALYALHDPRWRPTDLHYLELLDHYQGTDPSIVGERAVSIQIRQRLEFEAKPAAMPH
jgi:tetratricopeptide (TPR) repeat protein